MFSNQWKNNFIFVSDSINIVQLETYIIEWIIFVEIGIDVAVLTAEFCFTFNYNLELSHSKSTCFYDSEKCLKIALDIFYPRKIFT